MSGEVKESGVTYRVVNTPHGTEIQLDDHKVGTWDNNRHVYIGAVDLGVAYTVRSAVGKIHAARKGNAQ